MLSGGSHDGKPRRPARPARKAAWYLLFLVACCMSLMLIFAHAALTRPSREAALREKAAMVKSLGLTDLCLFTEARYTRHPAMADLGTAFQDHPLSLEHFPSGSIIPPPGHLRNPMRNPVRNNGPD